MVKMVVSDLDQTLLHTEKFISPYTVSVLEKCREKGILIAFATARSTQSSTEFLAAYQPDIFIGYGGSLTVAGGEVISRFDLPAELAARLAQECLAEPAITAVFAINESHAVASRLEGLDSSWAHYRLIDFAKEDAASYLKIQLFADYPEAVERVASHYLMLNMLRFTGENLYQFTNREALKWNAVQAVAAHYGIPTDEIIAFGDDVNDLEMIENCGIGVAMENAIDPVKAAADFVCDTNDNDGVARWLEEHIL
jgi:Cof subfamily protein (haloacid dehalogenase superfamily)